MDFKIINYDDKGLASFGIPDVTKKISGFDKLTQIVVLEIFRNPGRNVFFPQEGSGLRAAVGRFNYSEESEIRSYIIQRIDQVKKNIIELQNIENILDVSERLKAIDIISFSFDANEGIAYVSIKVYNELGQSRTLIV
jgi:hypothetical protein